MHGVLRAMVFAMMLAAGACDRGGGGGDGMEPAGPSAPVADVRVVASYPHDPGAFTQGLLWHGGHLYESTGRYGESSLRRVELQSGEVLQRFDVPQQYFAEGLALLGGRLYQLTWQGGTGFVYDLEGFTPAGTFPYQGEGWGLTTDGTQLIQSDGSNVLRFLDPQSFAVRRTVEVTDGGRPVHDLNELEWVRGEVWANVWHDMRIARIDPAGGRVVGWVDLAPIVPAGLGGGGEAVPNGIAYDEGGDRLFVTGKLWPTLFEVSVDGVAGGGTRAASGAAPAGTDSGSAGG